MCGHRNNTAEGFAAHSTLKPSPKDRVGRGVPKNPNVYELAVQKLSPSKIG